MQSEETLRYLKLVREGPRATAGQITAFARFVANDHSWYKRLPLIGIGEPFFVFLDPTVHAAEVRREDGSAALRDVVQDGAPGFARRLRVDTRPGDVEPWLTGGPLNYTFSNTTTAEYRERYGYWRYWNFGPPEQPGEAALTQAAASLRVRDTDRVRLAVPAELLELGLVYLRGTISGFLGPPEVEYEERRLTQDLPDPDVDQAVQLAALEDAMRRVTARVYDG